MINLENRREYDRETYVLRKRLHFCVKCKKQDAYTLGGRSYCAECIKKINSKYRERYAGDNNVLKRINERKKKLKSEHKCTNCGKQIPIDDTHTECSKCRAKRRLKSAEKRIKNGIFPKQILRENGICTLCCRSPAVEGKKVCAECREPLIKNLKLKTQNNDRHIWRMQENARIEEVKQKYE